MYQKENHEELSLLCQPVAKESVSISSLAGNSHRDYLTNQGISSRLFPFLRKNKGRYAQLHLSSCLMCDPGLGTPSDLWWHGCLQNKNSSRILCCKGKRSLICKTPKMRWLFPGKALGLLNFPQVHSIFIFSLTGVFAEDFETEKLEGWRTG